MASEAPRKVSNSSQSSPFAQHYLIRNCTNLVAQCLIVIVLGRQSVGKYADLRTLRTNHYNHHTISLCGLTRSSGLIGTALFAEQPHLRSPIYFVHIYEQDFRQVAPHIIGCHHSPGFSLGRCVHNSMRRKRLPGPCGVCITPATMPTPKE